MTSKGVENIEVGTVQMKVVPPSVIPEKATLMVVQPHRTSCIPVMFERSSRTFWNPRFDSSLLEKYHQKISLNQRVRLLQYSLGFIILSCIAWSLYVGFQPLFQNYWVIFLVGLFILFLISVSAFIISFTRVYPSIRIPLSIGLALTLIIFSLLYFLFVPRADMTLVGIFIGCVEIITLMYTIIPMPLYVSMSLGVAYSIVFEICSALLTSMNSPSHIVGRILLHTATHSLGIHLFIISQVRQRSTFLRVGQSLKSRRDLQIEKQFKQDMIHSLMPPSVAQEIMSSRDENEEKKVPSSVSGVMSFRSFHMNKMEDVSILFADIVGFTKMSSNKSAEHLVSLLSDLFGRFDDICCKCGCEKISTLGDCYYCVSGCPTPRDDHARCCVEMGLSMCLAIKQFDEDHKEEVNMRVGVHTGTVLCGLVGTRRFKFDVWSHDVTIANTMESEGLPGRVHVSDHTFKFIENHYLVEKGQSVPDIRGQRTLIECFDANSQKFVVQHVSKEGLIDTWFIVERKPGISAFVDEGELRVPMAIKEAKKKEEAAAAAASAALVKDKEANLDESQKPMSAHLLSNNKERNDSTVGITTHLMPVDLMELCQEDKKMADLEVIECMRSCEDLQTYLYRPPINKFSLNFTDPDLEKEFQKHCLDDLDSRGFEFFSPTTTVSSSPPSSPVRTRALPHFTNLFDLFLALLFFLFISFACILSLKVDLTFWLVFSFSFLFLFLLLTCAVLESFEERCFRRVGCIKSFNRFISGWVVRHIIQILIASLPVSVVFSSFSCNMAWPQHKHNFRSTPFIQNFINSSVTNSNQSIDGLLRTQKRPDYQCCELFFCMALICSLVHFCNFTMLRSFLKTIFAALAGSILLFLVHFSVCNIGNNYLENLHGDNLTSSLTTVSLTTASSLITPLYCLFSWTSSPPILAYELILVVLLLILLISFINYDVEIGYRLCYHGDVQVAKDKKKILKEKEQADWLLHNIVPEHVADQLKDRNHYCENHKNVGVIFAKISNFDDFYDESYKGGKEYLRVLNELMGDFEELFDLPEFKDVEKIKTIGSCLMAASGLNKITRQQNSDPNSHLYALIEFATSIIEKVEIFNKDIFNFDFEMKIGFNSGEVTAGVIGTEKLLYDIWGDTVNIASRMYSTGVHNKIQVTEEMAKLLEDKFDFEYRGKTFVKGKGDMSTYLLVSKKKGATWN